MSSTLVGLHLSPPLPPANWAACLPARSTGGGGPLEVVTQQLVPATTAPGSLLLSYRATPRFHRGTARSREIFRSSAACCHVPANLLLTCSYQQLPAAPTYSQVWEEKAGGLSRAPPSQVETLPGAHKSGNLPPQPHSHASNTF